MRRKLLAAAQYLGVKSDGATRLAAAASDHAKEVIRSAALEVAVSLLGTVQTHELCVDFLSTHPSGDRLLRLGFDRVEPRAEGELSGWRARRSIDPIAADDPAISRCQSAIAEQGVDELLETLNRNNQDLQTAKEVAEDAPG